MAVNIRFDIKGLQKTVRGLDRTQNRVRNFAPFWRSIAVPIIKNRLRDIFNQEGPGWAPLAESTLQSRLYPGLPILQQTGALMESVVDHPVLQITRKQLLYGTSNPYAEFHEEGTFKMPARPFLGPAMNEIMVEIRNQYINYIRQDTLRF